MVSSFYGGYMNNYYGISSYGEYLEHHGREGQRKGVQNGPPYPLDSKTVSSAYGSRAQKFASNLLSKLKKKSSSNSGSESSGKTSKAKEEKPEETVEERKARIIKENNVQEAWEHKEDFTTKEINDIIQRVTAENNLEKLVAAKHTSAFKKGVQFLKESNDVMTTVVNAYNNYNNLKKIFSKDTNNSNNSNNSNDSKDKSKDKKSKFYNVKEGIELYGQVKGLLPDKKVELTDLVDNVSKAEGDSSNSGGGKKKKRNKKK